jgi:flagellar brake protein
VSTGETLTVQDRVEILSTLQRMAAGRDPVALHWNQGVSMALSTLLSINPDFEEMVFDCPADPDANRGLLQTEGIRIMGTLDGVRIELSARRAAPTVHDGRPALRMRLPESMVRIQRREHSRVRPPLTCEFAHDLRGRVRVYELRVVDLSVGGVGLSSEDNEIDVQVGDLLENCRINIEPPLVVGLEVMNLAPERIGCRFTKLGRSVELALARYIAKMHPG